MKIMSAQEYARVLYEVTQDLSQHALSQAILEFAKLLAKHQQLGKADRIILEFEAYAKKQMGIMEIAITSAHALDATTREAIKKIFGNKVEETAAVDTALLGGVKIQTADKIFDASLRTQLVRLKQQLT